MQLGTGLSDSSSGGWALVVAYGDPAAPSRNLSVFDGLQNVSSTGTVTIPLSGFQTPLSGPVTSAVGIVAYEGDLGTTGDGAQIQGAAGFSALANAVNPATEHLQLDDLQRGRVRDVPNAELPEQPRL